ncbi:hypothetical protein UFOVP1375_21 [uncultured Caudovirales phage]|uniref:Uncharacterized protein n=1 Tax=uncultured Caudovirales phage TaxID=2100421 RepID=A0A6J5S233_9CAUD|nr:hypothetical protein UFOVP1107_30 [uncultured Caudovirales phage]CAB4187799.1 hypothetical protein UFOVP1171_6 [uncultured Caudovirales phage]CAB4202578.1 hypothetical protein UFOVP1375_21 [uncultured Caudovirales phage]CAB4214810.1 hypothetical protein UFOVP1471_25 [uncultured Caudovirales phage]
METEPSIRESIEAAMPEEDDAVETVVDNTPAPEPTEKEPQPERPQLRAKEAKPTEDKSPEDKPTEAKSDGIQAGPKSSPKADSRAPASWHPETREHWAALPESVRTEVARREREVQTTLKETAEARKYAEQIERTIAPYQMFIKAENSNPLQAIDNLMSTAARLRTGSSQDIAQLVSGLVKQFGVGRFGQSFIEQLDSALVGEIPRVDAQQQQLQQAMQQQLAPIQQFMSQHQNAQAQAQQNVTRQAEGEVLDFIEKAEFAEDVREDMADLMEMAQRRGRDLSLGDAYRQACAGNEHVRSVLVARQKTQGAQKLTGAAQRARSAAVSVSGAPAMGAPQQAATDVRSAIEAAIASHSR